MCFELLVMKTRVEGCLVLGKDSDVLGLVSRRKVESVLCTLP